MAFKESSANPKAVRKIGRHGNEARGYLQITPVVWKQLGIKVPYKTGALDPVLNLKVGITYLGWLHDYCSQNHPNWSLLNDSAQLSLVLAGNNGGPTRIKERGWNIERMYPETKNYVKNLVPFNYKFKNKS